MVSIPELIIVALWVSQAVWQQLRWIYWLQTKEYRFDRFSVLFSSVSSSNNILIPLIFAKLLAITAAFILQSYFILLLLFVICNLFLVKDLYARKIRKPVFTQRANRILVTSNLSIIITLLVFLSTRSIYFTVIIGEVGLIIFPLVGILWTTPFVLLSKKREVALAKQKIQNTNTFVIGITGSYGKTSTKEFLTQILQENSITEKTIANENTEFGVARKILNSFNINSKYFVVEMGAYKKGEIQRISDIVSPKMGIITGIEAQHLALFGSLQNIIKAKYELINSLPPDGLALFNYSNKYCRKMGRRAVTEGRTVHSYKLETTQNKKIETTITAKIEKINPENIAFTVRQGKDKHSFSINIAGQHFVENITGSILAARLIGLSWKQIEQGVNKIKPYDKIMQKIKLKTGTTVIDDSYNSTPASFFSALDYIENFDISYKKIVVTPGIIELGSHSETIHKKIGTRLKKMDAVILTNSDFKRSILAGMGNDKHKLFSISNLESWHKYINSLHGKTVVLLEGRLPESYRKDLLEN